MTILTTSCKFHSTWKSLLIDLTFILLLARPSWEIMSIFMVVLCNAHPSTTRAGCSSEALNSVELTINSLPCDFVKPMLLRIRWLFFNFYFFQVKYWAGLAQIYFYEFYYVKLLKYTPLDFIQKRLFERQRIQKHKIINRI